MDAAYQGSFFVAFLPLFPRMVSRDIRGIGVKKREAKGLQQTQQRHIETKQFQLYFGDQAFCACRRKNVGTSRSSLGTSCAASRTFWAT